MKNFILKVVNGEVEEWPRIASLLAMGFFSGIFLSTYDVAATTLFLETFKDNREEMLALAMVGAGTLGIISALLIGRFQRRISYKLLASRFMALIAISVGFIAISLRFIAPDSEVLVFLSSVIIGPSNAVVILLFWGIFGRIFKFREAKRLAGGIDTGQAIATILGLFAIPILEPILPSIIDFLLISTVAVMGGFLVSVAIGKKFVFMEAVNEVGVEERQKKDASLIKNKYASVISLFVICSAMAASFVDYTFLATAGERFSDQGELTRFLSFFGATVIITSFLVQTFLNDLIIEMFGLKISLLLLPIILALFTAGALAVAQIFGYTSETAGDNFLIFFVVISLSKLFVSALRDSLENPTVKLFFFPLDLSIRFDIQTKIEGFVSQSAGLIAGLIITALERFQFFDLIECQYIIFIIIAIWVLATIRMHKGYSTALSKTLIETKKSNKNAGENDHVIPKLLQKELQEQTGAAFAVTLKIAQKIDPLLVERYVCRFIEVEDIEKQQQMLQVISRRRVFTAMSLLKAFTQRYSNHPSQQYAAQVLQGLELAKARAQDFDELQKLATSEYSEDRVEACRLIPMNYSEETQQLLIPLLRDLQAEVKRTAFLTVGKLQIEEFLPTLIDHMSVVGFENTSVSAILNYGEKAIVSLDNAFYKNGQKQNAMINIVQIYGLIDDEKAARLLLRKTGFPDKRIVKEVLYSLNFSNWTATGAMTAFIKNHLEQAVGNTLWVLLASQEIKKHEDNKFLRVALEELTAHNYEEIFLLLSIIYDKQSVQLIENNIKSGTPDSIGYAIELLNIVAEDELLPVLVPILDDSSIEDKLKKLEGTFLRDSFDSIEVLRQIIIRDYNTIDKWTRVCAIHSYAMHPKTSITKDIVANLFNPDELVRETTAWAICREDKEAYDTYCKRLPENIVKEMNQIVLPAVLADDEGLRLSMEKVVFLYKIPLFEGVPGMVLSDLTEWIEEITFEKGATLGMRDELGHKRTVIIIEGHLSDTDDTGLSDNTYFPYDVISNVLVADSSKTPETLVAMSEGRAYTILSERLYEIMGDHYALTEKLLHNLQQQVKLTAQATAI